MWVTCKGCWIPSKTNKNSWHEKATGAMVFQSSFFLVFFLATWIAHYVAPQRWRQGVLLAASVAFYAALLAPQLLVALAVVVAVSYYFAIMIEKQSGRTRSTLLWAGIAIIVMTLIIVKYVPRVAQRAHPGFGWSTVGVSFFTLQAISYLVDVHMGTQAAERKLPKMALYFALFPKLLQGPIERAGKLMPQLDQDYRFEYENVRTGTLQFCWGLFKKVVIADRLAVFVDSVYGDVHAVGGATLLLGTVLYAFQVYADFSGYTDMALGVARTFNIELTQNFRSPYCATSVVDFWRRWHISFSQWLQDYVFKPLQIAWRDSGIWGTVGALMATFVVSGAWHGAYVNFIIWGLLHASYMAFGLWSKSYRTKVLTALHVAETPLHNVIRIGVTFCLVCFTWIFFRANTLNDALYVTSHLTGGAQDLVLRIWGAIVQRRGTGSGLRELLPGSQRDNLDNLAIALSGLLILAIARWGGRRKDLFSRPLFVRWAAYVILVVSTGMLAARSGQKFIYLGF
jgi:alginate O-acetyltransferase complex protein AlgI